jgi:Reverse transcriptase (RNA-dependent DNA polymerase)
MYPLPRIDVIFDQMKEAKLMSKFDIRDGYYNIQIHPNSQWITAVKTEEGLFEAKVMPFGLSNALATFQRMMVHIFTPLKRKYPKYIHWYMDNFIIATLDDQKLHDQMLRLYLGRVLTKGQGQLLTRLESGLPCGNNAQTPVML